MWTIVATDFALWRLAAGVLVRVVVGKVVGKVVREGMAAQSLQSSITHTWVIILPF